MIQCSKSLPCWRGAGWQQPRKTGGKVTEDWGWGGGKSGSRVLRGLEAEEKCKIVILTIPSQTKTQNVFALNLL